MARTVAKRNQATQAAVFTAKVNEKEVMISQSQTDLFESVCYNLQQVGNKAFAFIPVSLLVVDNRFQRVDTSSKQKVNKLSQSWDDDKMDPIRVTIHEKEKCFSPIDGYHRLSAAKLIGKTHLACEVIDVPQDDAERLKREAELFATQMDCVENLTALQKHNANLIRGVKENVILDKLCKKYDIPIRKDSVHGGMTAGYLTGFWTALEFAKADSDVLDKVFDIICYVGWKNETNGFSTDTLRMFYAILTSHPDRQDEIVVELKRWLRSKDAGFIGCAAMTKYPERKRNVRNALILEDYLHKTINLEYVYKAKVEKKSKQKL